MSNLQAILQAWQRKTVFLIKIQLTETLKHERVGTLLSAIWQYDSRFDHSQTAIASGMKSRRYEIVDGTVEMHRSILFFFSSSAPGPLPRFRATRRSDSVSVSHSHTVFRHVTRGRPSLMPCRMQKRIMAYAPCCVSKSRASDSSRFWRWKKERANWNLCLVHVTGADVYDFAKRELRATRVFSVESAQFSSRGGREVLSLKFGLPLKAASICTLSEKRINFSWFGRRYSLIAIELDSVCTIYERAKNFRIQRYMSLIEEIRSLSF